MNAPSIVYLNGRFVPLAEARVSILDRGFCYGDGLFETLRAYGGKVFKLGWHLDRLEESAKSIYLELPESKESLTTVIHETLHKNDLTDAVIRLTVTRGESFPGLTIDESSNPTLVVYARPFKPVPEVWYREGIKIALLPQAAQKIASVERQIKSLNYLSPIMSLKQAQDRGAVEAVMLDENGRVCDGATSNIFIIQQRILRTPAVNEYVLAGITRKAVLHLSHKLGIVCEEKDLCREDIYQADEVFITNSGLEILPVTQVDDVTVGDGRPGPQTRKLHENYLKWVDEDPS